MATIRDYDFWPETEIRRNGLKVYVGWDINDTMNWAIASIRDLSPRDITVGMRIARFMDWVETKTNYQTATDNSLRDNKLYITVRLNEIEMHPDTFEELKEKLYRLNWDK